MKTDRTTQQKLDDAMFRIHELESRKRYKVTASAPSQDGLENVVIIVHAPEGFLLMPGMEIVVADRKKRIAKRERKDP